MSNPAIVVIGYNRTEPFKRLLKSIASAHYPSDDITLHISIDASTNMDVKNVADQFEWKHGNKVVDLKDERRGLLKHVLECGQLSSTYGSIIVLEDDLIVAPGFYEYAKQAEKFYAEEAKIAGVSLFTYPVEENNFYPFEPIKDDSDVHFIQVASSWGQCWNKEQWTTFIAWFTEFPNGKPELLPKYIQDWGGNSWKRLFINYMIDTDRYFVFPNNSFSSNFEEEGTHASNTGLFQVQMYFGTFTNRFKSISNSTSIYDAYFELLPGCLKELCPSLRQFDFEIDLFGVKPFAYNAELVFTTKRHKKAIRSYGVLMKPLVQNILNEIEGNDLVLCRKEDIIASEKDRFLMLNVASTTLDQYARLRSQKFEQVSLVIPIINDQLNALTRTIKAMNSDRFYDVTLLFVCSQEIVDSVKEITLNVPLNIEYVNTPYEKLDDLLQFGIAHCSTEYCGWVQPGMFIDLEKMEAVARIFQSMRQIQIIRGIDTDINQVSYSRLNTSNFRWTPQLAISDPLRASKMRSEFVFWRTSLVSKDAISRMRSSTLFIELLKLNPIYVAAINLGDYGDIEAVYYASIEDVRRILNASEFQPKTGLRTLYRPIFRFWFRRNVPIFRFFYKEMEQFPLVIRYDFKNDSYYLSNY